MISTISGVGATDGKKKAATNGRFGTYKSISLIFVVFFLQIDVFMWNLCTNLLTLVVSWVIPTISSEGAMTDEKRARANGRSGTSRSLSLPLSVVFFLTKWYICEISLRFS